jgi:HAD superfamily hydrolase (TIGR01509 family)
MHRALIFDLDGTLADTMPAHYLAWTDTLAPHGLELTEERFYRMAGVPSLGVVQIVAGERGLVLDFPALAAEKEARFLESLHTIRPIEPVLEIAREFRGKLPMAVATGAVRPVLNRILAQIGAVDWFQATVTAEETARHKPEPDVFLEAAQRLGVAPADCRVYEDADYGIEAARRAGMAWVDIRTLIKR